MAQEMDQQFVEYVVKSIVDHPDDVTSERKIDEMGVLITLKVHAEDMGQLIGRQGQTAKSIRTLLRVIGAKNNARVNLKIIEPEGSTHVRKERPEGGQDRRMDRGAPAPRRDDMGTTGSQDPATDIVDDLNL